jgi:glyoxylase-like metal-dependent hydrolase (beta-lactamase superfamily II)
MTQTLLKILVLSGLALFNPWVRAADIAFEPVAPDIFAFIGDTGQRSYENGGLNANIGLVVTPDGALLIDSGASFQGARQIAEAALKVTKQPIKWVINTGGQDHRWLGNGYFVQQGAQVFAHVDAKADMLARGPVQLASLKDILKEKLDGTELTLPTTLLSGNDEVLNLGGMSIEIKHRGGGHTPGDVAVWLPAQQVLFSGDIACWAFSLSATPGTGWTASR